MKPRILLLAVLLYGCSPPDKPVLVPSPSPMVEPARNVPAWVGPTPLPQIEKAKPLIADPVAPKMTEAGLALIVEYEGYVAQPEAPDARFSGISLALGYDFSTVKPSLSVLDWSALSPPAPQRLAATYPYTGRAAQQHLHEVKDIHAPRSIGFAVFNKVDVPRFYEVCRKAYPGFTELRPYARDAVLSLVYNRGASKVGSTRKEMRELEPLIKTADYAGIAACIRRMKRVWIGTEIERGMSSRREGEARLVERL